MSKTEKIIENFDQYVMGNYRRYPIVFEKGKGCLLWDVEGGKYLDFFSSWATTGLGHSHPGVIEAVKEQVEKMIHIPNIYYTEAQGELAYLISKISFPGKTFFCNSGAEANETAIKLARRYGAKKGKYEIITMRGSFHGRTLATVAATAQEKYHEGFEPLPQGFQYAKFNNIKSVEKLISEKTVAIMLEPIQGEGGIHVATQEFLFALRKICNEQDIILIFDEVQTGIGRTGKYFGFQNYKAVEPDVMTLAKALGNGTAIGAVILKNKYKDVLVPGTHASTFGGNPLACSAAIAVLKIIEEENILENVEKQGNYLKNRLEQLKERYPELIKEVRGLGLMLGMELLIDDGSDIISKCLSKKVLFNCTQKNVLRFMPALNVGEREIDAAMNIFEEVIKGIKK